MSSNKENRESLKSINQSISYEVPVFDYETKMSVFVELWQFHNYAIILVYLPDFVMTISVPRLWKSSHSSFASRWTFGSSSTSSSGSSVLRGLRCAAAAAAAAAAWCPSEEKWRPVSAAPISCSMIGLPSAPGRDREPLCGSARAGKKGGWWPSIALIAYSGPRWGKNGWYAILDPWMTGSLIGKLIQVQTADVVWLKKSAWICNRLNICPNPALLSQV